MQDPWQLKPPPQKEETLKVTDRAQPGVEYVVRLRQLTIPESLAAQSEADELTAEFVDGLDGEPPNAYPAPVPFEPSAKLFQNVCFLAKMEQGPRGERLGMRGFLGISVVMPAGFNKLTRAATRLNKDIIDKPATNEEGNSPRKVAASSSSRPPSAVTNAIPA